MKEASVANYREADAISQSIMTNEFALKNAHAELITCPDELFVRRILGVTIEEVLAVLSYEIKPFSLSGRNLRWFKLIAEKSTPLPPLQEADFQIINELVGEGTRLSTDERPDNLIIASALRAGVDANDIRGLSRIQIFSVLNEKKFAWNVATFSRLTNQSHEAVSRTFDRIPDILRTDLSNKMNQARQAVYTQTMLFHLNQFSVGDQISFVWREYIRQGEIQAIDTQKMRITLIGPDPQTSKGKRKYTIAPKDVVKAVPQTGHEPVTSVLQ